MESNWIYARAISNTRRGLSTSSTSSTRANNTYFYRPSEEMDQFGRRRQLACKLYWYPYTQYIGEDDNKIAKEEEAVIRPFRIHFFFFKKKVVI